MEVEVKAASEKDASDWDSFLDESQLGTIYHKWDWLKLAEKYSVAGMPLQRVGCTLHPLMGYSGKKLVAVFPLFAYRHMLHHTVLSPPSRVEIPYLGPITDDSGLKQSRREALCNGLLAAVDGYVKSELRPVMAGITTSPGVVDSRPYRFFGFEVSPNFTYEIPLSKPLESIKAGLNKDIRSKIKSSEAAGVDVGIGGADISGLYDLQRERRMEQGGANLILKMPPREYFKEVQSTLAPENLLIASAHLRGEPAGGVACVVYKGRVQAWFGNPKTAVDGVNELLTWRLIEWSKESGKKSFEIVSAAVDYPHLTRFKSQFNPHLVPYFDAKRHYSKVYKFMAYQRRLLR
jgi:hypothetical protein